jgi:uncharacterized protein
VGFLDAHVPLGGDGVLGLLHAVAVAPSVMPPSRWLPAALPDGALSTADDSAQLIDLLLRCHNDVVAAIEEQRTMTPYEEDAEACEHFAAGYVAGATLDPAWRGDADRWTFAAPFAYLCGRRDLVPARMLGQIDAGGSPEEARATMRRQMGSLVIATRDSFRHHRIASMAAVLPGSPVKRSVPRVGRNEPCPCGSGKKYKKCCGAS